MNIREAPKTVKRSEMCRDWWIHYRWSDVRTIEAEEPLYLNCGLRPISEAVEAAAQFDTYFYGKSAEE
jgi:hypothetical protein